MSPVGSNHQRGEQSLAQLSVVLVTQSHARPHLVVLTFSTHLFSDEAMTEFMVTLKKKSLMGDSMLSGTRLELDQRQVWRISERG